jgi:hypothetical protein
MENMCDNYASKYGIRVNKNKKKRLACSLHREIRNIVAENFMG